MSLPHPCWKKSRRSWSQREEAGREQGNHKRLNVCSHIVLHLGDELHKWAWVPCPGPSGDPPVHITHFQVWRTWLETIICLIEEDSVLKRKLLFHEQTGSLGQAAFIFLFWRWYNCTSDTAFAVCWVLAVKRAVGDCLRSARTTFQCTASFHPELLRQS